MLSCSASKNLKRRKYLFTAVHSAVADAMRVTQRKSHWQVKRNRKVEVQLKANILQLVFVHRAGICRNDTAENSAAHRAKIKAGHADVLEADWRKIPFRDGLEEGPRPDLINLEARKAVVEPIAFDLAVIDIVVPKCSKIKDVQRICARTGGKTRGRVQPQ